jgi:hypothetical protein
MCIYPTLKRVYRCHTGPGEGCAPLIMRTAALPATFVVGIALPPSSSTFVWDESCLQRFLLPNSVQRSQCFLQHCNMSCWSTKPSFQEVCQAAEARQMQASLLADVTPTTAWRGMKNRIAAWVFHPDSISNQGAVRPLSPDARAVGPRNGVPHYLSPGV